MILPFFLHRKVIIHAVSNAFYFVHRTREMQSIDAGWLKELRTLCNLVKAAPSEMKAVVKDGTERCPSFVKLIDQMVVVKSGYMFFFSTNSHFGFLYVL